MMVFMVIYIVANGLIREGLHPLYAYDFGDLIQKPSRDKAKEFQGFFESAGDTLKDESKLTKAANKTVPDYEKTKDKQDKLSQDMNAKSDEALKSSGEDAYAKNKDIGTLRELLDKEPDETHSFQNLLSLSKAHKEAVACKKDKEVLKKDFPIEKRKIRESKKEMEYSRVTCQGESSKVIACRKTLTHLTCKNRGNCSAGGIVRGSESARLKDLTLQYPHLEVGTLETIYDEKNCKIINEEVSFEIKSLALIGEFRLLHMSYSDWIRLELNGVEIVNTTGGHGSFSMEASRMGWFSIPKGNEYCLLVSGEKKHTCNTKEFYKKDLNLDLKPYLKEGSNHLKIDLAFGNSGQLYLKFFAPERCCTEFDEHWEERCVLK